MGAQYELEAQRLLREYPNTILITNRTKGVETKYSIPNLNGLATKSNFANLIQENLFGPVFLCDADLFPVVSNPLKYFKVKEETDIAYVIYGGTWHYPAKLRHFEKAVKRAGKINSGFMYFKNLKTARDVCSKWYAKYKERMDEYLDGTSGEDRQGEYDEPSLCLVLAEENYKLEYLDPKWNCWNTGPKSECPMFVQKHLDGHDPYAMFPNICNNFW